MKVLLGSVHQGKGSDSVRINARIRMKRVRAERKAIEKEDDFVRAEINNKQFL